MVDNTTVRRWGRWVGTFVGFPLAGVAARAAGGNIDGVGAAMLGGVAGGAVLGAVQAFVGGLAPAVRARWTLATAAGFGAGLAAGAALVGYRTDTASLVVLGAVSGAAVGVAQAAAMPQRVADRVAWAVATPAIWALGWLITSQVIVDADRQHAVFGSSGALTVAALAGLLHAARRPSVASSVAPTLVAVAADRRVA